MLALLDILAGVYYNASITRVNINNKLYGESQC